LNTWVSFRSARSSQVGQISVGANTQGIAWEHFHTLGDIPVFNEAQKNDTRKATLTSACCSPASSQPTPEETGTSCCPPRSRGKPVGVAVKAAGACC
jgi:hypothetical protein